MSTARPKVQKIAKVIETMARRGMTSDANPAVPCMGRGVPRTAAAADDTRQRSRQRRSAMQQQWRQQPPPPPPPQLGSSVAVAMAGHS
jgi:hypothetical protein